MRDGDIGDVNLNRQYEMVPPPVQHREHESFWREVDWRDELACFGWQILLGGTLALFAYGLYLGG